MKILVTGGAGYIGSTTSDHLLTAGHQVTIIDNLRHGHKKAIPTNASFVEADIADTNKLNEVFSQQFDAVMHFAALIEAGESMINPDLYFDNNVNKSQIFFDAAVKSGINNIVFSSTAAVYKSKSEPISEDDEIEPANVYGQTKRQTEEYLQKLSENQNINVAILRYFNAAGASLLSNPTVRGEAHNPETHLIPNIIKIILENKSEFSIHGGDYPTPDGTCIRDYIHVDDLANAHLLALDALVENKLKFDIFNLGNGNGFSNKEVVSKIIEVTNHQLKISTGPRREGDAARLVANSEKAKKVLGWQPKYGDLKTIVESAWQWHKNNPKGYK